MARTATFTTALGTKVWEITAKSVKDFSGFTTSYELEAEKNNAVEGSPLSNIREIGRAHV